jgi:hypothetical protein
VPAPSGRTDNLLTGRIAGDDHAGCLYPRVQVNRPREGPVLAQERALPDCGPAAGNSASAALDYPLTFESC